MPRLQRVHAVTEQPQGFDDVAMRCREINQRTWLSTDDAAIYLGYRGKTRLRSVYRFLQTHGIPVRRRGVRSILVARADLDRAIKG